MVNHSEDAPEESRTAADGDGRAGPGGGWQPAEIAALAVVALAGLLASLTQSLLIPVLPKITTDLGSSTGDVQWLLTSTLLVASVAVPVAGRLGDLYGKKAALIGSAAALCVGSLVSALSDSLVPMIVGRAIVGVSMAVIPLGISLLSTMLPRARASAGIALVSAMLGIGGALGVPLAAWIGEHTDYHLLFWICAAGGALSVAGTWLLLTEPAGRSVGRLDVPGTVVLAGALVCLLLPLSQAAGWGWSSPTTIGLLVAAVVLLVAFVLWERRASSPLVDVVVNSAPSLLLTNIASTCVGFALFATLIGTASYVEAPRATGYGFGSSVVVGGLCLLPSGLAMLVLSPASAAITNRVGPKITLAIGATIVAAGFVVRIVLTGHLWEVILGTSIAGAGTGIAYAAMPALVNLAAPRSSLAAANGLNTLFRSVGSSLASAVGGTLFASQVVVLAGQAMPSLHAYRVLFGICAGAALLGALIALTVPAAQEREEAPRAEPALA
ncbi:MFS transporter [Actinacidiphila reveromycinica]|uniref:MFS transporter n=1 Tax=Actinacidiphila reveromycinica TaxID=659352 RepID=UPI001921901E|nr:MFS transporter [Streptomyces sp. SN-593]